MTRLTPLSQVIHNAPRWHQKDQFQNPVEIHIASQPNEALGAVVIGLDARKAQSGETIFPYKTGFSRTFDFDF